jgi:hypothetical protein
MDVTLMHSGHQHVSPTSVANLQGDENKNTNIINTWLNHSTVFMHLINSRNMERLHIKVSLI